MLEQQVSAGLKRRVLTTSGASWIAVTKAAVHDWRKRVNLALYRLFTETSAEDVY